jgi:hypothetical protein
MLFIAGKFSVKMFYSKSLRHFQYDQFIPFVVSESRLVEVNLALLVHAV